MSPVQALKTLDCYCAKFSGFLHPDTDASTVIVFKGFKELLEKL